MATMPTRAETLKDMFYSILPQVDLFYIFLDNFEDVPTFLAHESKVVISRSQEKGNFHAAGRFLALEALEIPSVALIVDDDIRYPENYVSTMVENLAVAHGEAIVGVLGRSFRSPYRSYVADAVNYHFAQALTTQTVVDEVGVGTCAFLTEVMNVNVRKWTCVDANDIQLAIEGEKRGLPRICVQRPDGWLRPYSTNQPDSLSVKTLADHSRHSALMRSLISMRSAMPTSSPVTKQSLRTKGDLACLLL
jgi:hypothetical protein